MKITGRKLVWFGISVLTRFEVAPARQERERHFVIVFFVVPVCLFSLLRYYILFPPSVLPCAVVVVRSNLITLNRKAGSKKCKR